jgi:hypothetical protein
LDAHLARASMPEPSGIGGKIDNHHADQEFRR